MGKVEIQQKYMDDGRMPIEEIYKRCDKLVEAGWEKHTIWVEDGEDLVPIYAYTTPVDKNKPPKDALWIISGIHGEEPAGPNAIALSVDKLIEMAKNGLSEVVIPVLNPKGYSKNWRYFYYPPEEDYEKVRSVSDAGHVLPDQENPMVMRRVGASNNYSKAIIDMVNTLKELYPPLFLIDPHEDSYIYIEGDNPEDRYSYGYGYGDPVYMEEIYRIVTELMKSKGIRILENREVHQGSNEYQIVTGFVRDAYDWSIDEFFYRILKTKGVIVPETAIDGDDFPLELRVRAHQQIIESGAMFMEMVRPRA